MNIHSPFYSEKEIKGFDFSPWGGLEGFLRATSNGAAANSKGAALKRLVPDLSRAVDMVAVGVSSLPFDIVDTENGDVFDSSIDWENNIGGMPNPQRLLYLLASSLCGGEAYLIPQHTPRLIFDLQYAAPHTITPQLRMSGIEYFDRATDMGEAMRYEPDQIVYFWLPDSDVEIGPALNTPLGNAMQDAELTLNVKNTMRIYGERGFVPITLLGAKGVPNEGERQKAEGFFDRLLKGGFNTLAKIVNSEALTLIKVGAGMEELKGVYIEILRQSKEDIAQAFGIPTALFMSDNAFASEFNALRKQFYESSRFKSIYQTIEETFTDQVLKPYGKAMFFRPETLDIFQEDESSRSNSLSSLVSSIDTNPSIAKFGMSLLGYDMTEEQEHELDEIIMAKEQAAEQRQANMTQTNPVTPIESAEDMGEAQGIEDGEDTADMTEDPLSPDEIKDVHLWHQKAKAWYNKGKGSAVDWETKHLRESVAEQIRGKLAVAENALDIEKAFQVGITYTTTPKYKSEILVLAQAINRIADETN